MTREETIKWLKSLKAEIGKSEHRALWHYAEAIDMAIEALQTPPISQRSMYQLGYVQGQEDAFKQDTGKLNNPDDSLLTADSEACKEQKSKLDRKTEPMKTTDYCDICKRDMCEFCVADNANPYCVPSHYEIKQDEPQKSDLISRAEAIEAVHDACNYCDTCDLKDVGCSQIRSLKTLPSADRPRPINPTIVVDLESGVVPISACEPRGPKTIVYESRPKGEWRESREQNILMAKRIEKGETWRVCSTAEQGL